jgi:hypothetical protein
MIVSWKRYYVVTYATQKKNSLESPLLKTIYMKGNPIDFIEEKKAEDPNVNFSLIFCESISKKHYKMYT